MYYLSAFLILGLLIFIHELGHFLAAKSCKMPVEVFAIGFGKTIFSWKRKETTYKLNILPLGGYVSINGENDASIEGGFLKQAWYKRLLVLSAGIIFNILFTIIIFFILFSTYGLPEKGIQVMSVLPQTKTVQYLKTGDLLIKINDELVTADGPATMQKIKTASEKNSFINLTILRDKEAEKLVKVPFTDINGKKVLGIEYSPTLIFSKRNMSIGKIISTPFKETKDNARDMLKGLKSLFVKASPTEKISDKVSGPVGIVKITGQIAKTSFPLLMYWMAMLSLNLGIMNALPIPALDGGQMFFLMLEMIVGEKRWNKKIVTYLNFGFLCLLFGFMIIISVSDVRHLFIK